MPPVSSHFRKIFLHLVLVHSGNKFTRTQRSGAAAACWVAQTAGGHRAPTAEASVPEGVLGAQNLAVWSAALSFYLLYRKGHYKIKMHTSKTR